MLTSELAKEMRNKIAPRGSLGLPPLLEERRWEYAIPDTAFGIAAVYDRLFVYQILSGQKETFSTGGKVLMPDTMLTAEKEVTPTGVIISAGCQALNIIRSNGMDLGHLVYYVQIGYYKVVFIPG